MESLLSPVSNIQHHFVSSDVRSILLSFVPTTGSIHCGFRLFQNKLIVVREKNVLRKCLVSDGLWSLRLTISCILMAKDDLQQLSSSVIFFFLGKAFSVTAAAINTRFSSMIHPLSLTSFSSLYI